MRNFVLRRLAWAVVLLLAISLVTFLIFYVFPGADPALIRAGRQPTPELIQQIRTNLGLDRSIAYQYVHWLRIFPGQGSCVEFNAARCASGFVLPWIVLALGFAAFYARMVRSSMLQTLREDYVRTARAKGLSEGEVVVKHAVRGALTP